MTQDLQGSLLPLERVVCQTVFHLEEYVKIRDETRYEM